MLNRFRLTLGWHEPRIAYGPARVAPFRRIRAKESHGHSI